MELVKDLLAEDQLKPKPQDQNALGFGRIFTDHMFVLDYTEGKGWHDPRIVPYGPFSLEPSALVFHYGQAIFEGLKAYRGPGDEILMFRPDKNIARMQRSAERVCMPAPPADIFMEGMLDLVRIEKDWVPGAAGTSLYVRPTMIATEEVLGVKPSSRYKFFIILSPVGAYYPEGFDPVKIHVEQDYVRAVSGGIGEAKAAANYVAGLKAQVEAHDAGYSQVLWLDACDRKTIEEVGTMNMFFVLKGQVVTAPLHGTILPGVTRESVLEMCKDMGYRVKEHRLTIDEVLEAEARGDLDEAFGAGTAAVISPVGAINYQGKEYQVADGKIGPIARSLYDELTGIQYGKIPDKRGWVVKL